MAIKYLDLADGTTTANTYLLEGSCDLVCLFCGYLGSADLVQDARGYPKALCPDCEHLSAAW